MTKHIPRLTVIAALLLVSLYSPLTLVTAQTTHTSTVTQLTTAYSTNIQATTVTSPTTGYTTVTEITNSTLHGTQTQFVPSWTTATMTLTSLVGGAVTATNIVTLTSVSTATTQILGNIWGESLAVLLFAAAIASYLIPKGRSKRPRGIVCRKCGNLNPPFAAHRCVKCGQPLNG